MARIDAQCRICRRAGKELMLKGDRCNSPKCAMVSRNTVPGVHGNKRRGKISPYGQQLFEKQRAKFTYGLREKQFRNLFEKAKRQGNTGLALMKMLELRLDNTIYTLGLGNSRAQARQLVGHGHILVNSQVVNIPSYQVKPGDIISVKPSKQQKKLWPILLAEAKKIDLPSWLNWNFNALEAKVLHEPGVEDIDQSINSQAIVEFYSR